MGRKSRFSAEEKFKYVLIYIEEKDSINHVASMTGIHHESLREWVHKYQSLGIDGLYTNPKNSRYPAGQA